jgi:hypothetical protein
VRVIGAAISALLMSGLVVTPPAGGSGPTLASGSDAVNDVRITRQPGLARADRRSIDLRGFVVSDRGANVRMTFHLLRVIRSPDLTQIFLVDIATTDLPYGQLKIATHPLSLPPTNIDKLQIEMVIEGTHNPQGFISCRRLPISMRNGRDSFWIEVPKRCLPLGEAQLKVSAQTTAPPSLAGLLQYSHDRLRVSEPVDLGGTVN